MQEPFIGQITVMAIDFAPRDWALCDGQTLSTQQYPHLFAVIGNTFGGDGVQTFALPDLRGRAALHPEKGYPLGGRGGAESVTLDQTQLPLHNHLPRAFSAPGTVITPANNAWAASNSNDLQYGAAGADDALMAPTAIGPGGNSQPHDNMPPVTVLNFVIALQGIFPSRD